MMMAPLVHERLFIKGISALKSGQEKNTIGSGLESLILIEVDATKGLLIVMELQRGGGAPCMRHNIIKGCNVQICGA